MAFGVSGGIFPVPGVTTVPVMAAIFLFRLNPVAAMLTNYLVTPLNIASIPIFIYGCTSCACLMRRCRMRFWKRYPFCINFFLRD